MADKYYSTDGVTCSIADVLFDSGFADGAWLEIDQDSDDTVDVVGTDGEVAVGKTMDRRGTVLLRLLQTSDGNDVLSAMRNAGAARGAPLSIGAIYIRDRNGRTLFQAERCWIAKPPRAIFDRGAQAREWKLRTGQLKRVDGGNRAI